MSVHLTWTSKHQNSKATMLRVYESFISRSTAQIANTQINEQAHRTQRQKDKTANTTQNIRILNDWSYYHSFFQPKFVNLTRSLASKVWDSRVKYQTAALTGDQRDFFQCAEMVGCVGDGDVVSWGHGSRSHGRDRGGTISGQFVSGSTSPLGSWQWTTRRWTPPSPHVRSHCPHTSDSTLRWIGLCHLLQSGGMHGGIKGLPPA